MQEKYDPKLIEPKWQQFWQERATYRTHNSLNQPKSYVLDMFPYPSGDGLHVGHPKGYIATDIFSRLKKMQGHNVLHPMGWDAFGLPAENYAIKNKIHPRVAVEKNIKRFKEQLAKIGFNYDWQREVNTTDPEFYKWTQWIFLQMLEKGLAYESHEPINWCPSCQTGLANEDLENGKCERCGSEVEKRPMRQWVLKITDYADRLLKDLAILEWPEYIKESQRNWIGRSEGAEIEFALKTPDLSLVEKVKVFTTRADTLFGVTYLVLAPEHPVVTKLFSQIENRDEVVKYAGAAKNKTEIDRTDAKKEKTGLELRGIKAINPATGEAVPVWVADYVLLNYGTGAVMAVPSHDERDFAFAKKYDLPMKEVVVPRMPDVTNPHRLGKEVVFRDAVIVVLRNPRTQKYLCLKWKKQPWVTFVMGGIEAGETPEEAAVREIHEETGYQNVKFVADLGSAQSEFFAAHKDVNRIAHTRNLLFELVDEERQELESEEAAIHELEWRDAEGIRGSDMTHSEMPLILRGVFESPSAFTEEGIVFHSDQFDRLSSAEARAKITEKFGQAVVKYKLRDWVFSRQRYWGEPIPVIHCDKCGVVPVPFKDLPVQLPEVEHYEPTGTGESPLANISAWVNIKCPKCGGAAKRETNTMPQWAGSSWYYLRYLDPQNQNELVDLEKEKYWLPVDMYVGGSEHATRHLIYARFWHKFLFDIKAVSTIEPFARLQNVGLILAEDGRKMSKRYGNVINPDDIIATWGADSLRLYEMFMGPFNDAIPWNTENMIGVRRFLEKVWRLSQVERVPESGVANQKIESLLHKTIKKVGEDIEAFKFNTAISALMIFLNEAEKTGLTQKQFEVFLKLLAPFAPHITEEIWSSNGKSIHLEAWPQYEDSKIVEGKITVVVQVNGRVRAEFVALPKWSRETIEREALSLPEMQKWLVGHKVKKVIFVPNKLINIVI